MRNPARRSRNIGTAKQGHGRDNEMRVPFPMPRHAPALFFPERLGEITRRTLEFGNHEITFITEKPRPSNAHACSIEEIARVLNRVRVADLAGIEFVVLRQPKRKEELLHSVWGRYLRDYEFEGRFGHAIILEAMDLSRVLRWRKPLSAFWQEELELLRNEGHIVKETAKLYEIRSTLEAVRQTQLFRTLPHEIGHHVHASRVPNFNCLPAREKETFAEKYAREFSNETDEIGSARTP